MKIDKPKMRAYFVSGNDEEYGGVSYVAETAREAKQMAFGHDALGDSPWIEITARWLKDADVEGLEKGEILPEEGLRRGAYSHIYGPCPYCHKDRGQRVYRDFCELCDSRNNPDE